MRKGVEVRLGPGDRERLEATIGWGNSPQKHVWRARIVLLSADGVGTRAIQRQTGKGKPTIWRWQARFMAEGLTACCMKPRGPLACRHCRRRQSRGSSR
jgi:Homeodomain-like domain-containing protein